MTEKMINALENKGLNRWTKGSYDRLYFSMDMLGLETRDYKSGSIAEATMNGEKISNAEAYRALSCKVWVDANTGKIESKLDSKLHRWVADAIIEAAESFFKAVEDELAAEEAEETEDNEEVERIYPGREETEKLAKIIREADTWDDELIEMLFELARRADIDHTKYEECYELVLAVQEALGVDLGE